MKRLIVFILLISSILSAQAQKQSEFPTFIGYPSGYWIGLFDLHTNRKIDATVFFDSQLATKSTSNLSEGSNQYFTIPRARGAMAAGYGVLYDPATGTYKLDTTVTNAKYTTNFVLGPTLNYNGELLEVAKTKLSRNSAVVADANYTITADDEAIVLPDPSTTRTCYLPDAATMQGLTISIVCASNGAGEWLLNGKFVQTATTGSSPFIENFVNSGLAAGQRLNLKSVNDNGTWRWFDLY